MDFDTIYKALQALFPEIDSRVLKAVALENRNDSDAALKAVLTKVLPCMNARSRSSSSPKHSRTNVQSPNGSEIEASGGQQNVILKNDTEQPAQIYDALCDNDQLLDDTNDAIHESSRDNNLLITECDQTKVPVSKFEANDSPENITLLKRSGSFNFLHLENDQSSICSEVENFEGHIGTSPEGNLVDFVSDLVEELSSPKSVSVELDANITLVDVGLSKSAQICSIDVLEDDIALERNKKKTLFTALESVINLMKEVELEESMTAQAKKDVSICALETLQKVENLKEKLHHAKEANEMHAGEVNGEKAILVTEVKELQTRLITLSDETDKSLGILNEMRQSLEVRLFATNKERDVAEKEKLDKENIAKKALDDQELVMEKVVQESNILNKQADENTKLREFLVERGHVVDSLQGEISVICKDVILLKKQFDECLPLSESLTSSQTSCILASSSSTMKSVAPVLLDSLAGDLDVSFEETRWKRFGSSFTDELLSSETEAAIEDHKPASDDGWEIFDL